MACYASSGANRIVIQGLPVWRADRGQVLCNTESVSLKGVSWFGMETPDNVPHGLWAVPLASLLDFLTFHKFNAIRIPISAQLSLALDSSATATINYNVNPELQGQTPGQILDKLVAECGLRGMLVMLDMHHLQATHGTISELWYDDTCPEGLVIRAWQTLVSRYRDSWNVFAADLKNEPHGCATWGDGNLATDWRLAAERLGAAVLAANPRLLVFVEGTDRSGSPYGCFWGECLEGAARAPVRLPGKVVYSPHIYGPDVFQQAYFSDPKFPANMPAIWDCHCGSLRHGSVPLVVGEWGGRAAHGTRDAVWTSAFVHWLQGCGLRSNFYWALNPNSGDTGGILEDDWKTPVQHKLDLLSRLNPRPTEFVFGPAT